MVAFDLPLLDLLSALRVGETKFDMSEIMLEDNGDVRPLLGDIRFELTEDSSGNVSVSRHQFTPCSLAPCSL